MPETVHIRAYDSDCPWLDGSHNMERCLRDEDEPYYPFFCTEINRDLFVICRATVTREEATS